MKETPNDDTDTNGSGIDGDTPTIDGLCSYLVTLTYSPDPGRKPNSDDLFTWPLDAHGNFTLSLTLERESPCDSAQGYKRRPMKSNAIKLRNVCVKVTTLQY